MDSEKKVFPWAPASVVAGFALGMFNWLGGKGTAAPAFDAGQALGGAVLVWCVLFLFGLRRAGAVGMVGSLCLVWFLAFGGLLASGQPVSLPGASGPKVSDQLDRVAEQATADTLVPIDEVQVGEASRDVVGQAKVFVSQVLNEMIAIQNEYMAEIQVIGWEKILDADRLSADADLSESLRMMNQARDAATRMCEQQTPRLEAAGKRIAAGLNLSEKEKQSILEGFLKGLREKAAEREEVCRLEIAILDEFGGVLGVFASDPGWTVENGQFLFTEDRHVERFNHHYQNITVMTEQQDALRKQAMAETQTKLREIGL